jgi:hypothetical protein
MENAIPVVEFDEYEDAEISSSDSALGLEEEDEIEDSDEAKEVSIESLETPKGDNKFRFIATSILSRQMYDYIKIGNYSDAIAIYELMKRIGLQISVTVQDRAILAYPPDRLPELLEEVRATKVFRPYALVAAIINYARNFQLEKALPLVAELRDNTTGTNIANAVIKTLLGHNRLDLALDYFEVSTVSSFCSCRYLYLCPHFYPSLSYTHTLSLSLSLWLVSSVKGCGLSLASAAHIRFLSHTLRRTTERRLRTAAVRACTLL